MAGSLQADDQLSRHILDWTPSFTFEQGIKETVAWYKWKEASQVESFET
jgi:nucleoside-diphosphate-sugar epimerase